MTNNLDEKAGTGQLKRVRDTVSPAELRELLERCHAAARKRGKPFFYLEESQFMGERYHATYLRDLAKDVHMDDLARRLDQGEFTSGLFEQLQAQWARPNGSSRYPCTLLPARPTARLWPTKRSRRSRHQGR